MQKVQSVAELMVAKAGCGITKMVHRGDHRMHLARSAGRGLSDQIPDRAALQKITVVHKDRMIDLGPRPRDQPGQKRQAAPARGLVGVVVPRQEVHMDVRGGEDAKADIRLAGSTRSCAL